jgi:hypothetical protein
VLPVYCLDPRQFTLTTHGTLKTGPFRARFLLQSVVELKASLRAAGSDLLVLVGRPEDALPPLLRAPGGGATLVLTQTEVTSEELAVERRLREAAAGAGKLEGRWGSSLYHLEDLPYSFPGLRDLPDVFTPFRQKVSPSTRPATPHRPTLVSPQPSVLAAPWGSQPFAGVRRLLWTGGSLAAASDEQEERGGRGLARQDGCEPAHLSNCLLINELSSGRCSKSRPPHNETHTVRGPTNTCQAISGNSGGGRAGQEYWYLGLIACLAGVASVTPLLGSSMAADAAVIGRGHSSWCTAGIHLRWWGACRPEHQRWPRGSQLLGGWCV